MNHYVGIIDIIGRIDIIIGIIDISETTDISDPCRTNIIQIAGTSSNNYIVGAVDSTSIESIFHTDNNLVIIDAAWSALLT